MEKLSEVNDVNLTESRIYLGNGLLGTTLGDDLDCLSGSGKSYPLGAASFPRQERVS